MTTGAVLVLAGAVIAPVVPRMTRAFLGVEYVDAYGTQWFYWFVGQALRSGEGPGHTSLYFFPWGKDVFAHTGANVLDAILAIPFRWALGPVLGYNLFVLAGMAASAWAFSRLARLVTDDRVAVGVGSALFAFTPFLLVEAREGRPTQALLVFPVLFLLYVWRCGTRARWTDAAAAGAMLALAGYQYWYYAFFGGMVCAAHGAWRVARPPGEAGGRWRILARHALIAGVALALTLPVALPLLLARGQDDEEIPGLLQVDEWTLRQSPPMTVEGTPIGLRMWQPATGYVGSYVWDPTGEERFLRKVHVLPVLAWLAALAWLIRPGRLARGPTLAMLATAAVLATGPVFVVLDHVLPNPIYIALARTLPFLQRLWWPERAVAYASILTGLMVVVGLGHLGRLGPWKQAAASLVVAALWAVELARIGLVPLGSWDATIPAGYRCLARGGEGAIIELPYSWTQAHLYYQTAHGRPIFGGMLENNPVFTPREITDLKERNTWIAALIDVTNLGTRELSWEEADRQELYDLGYRYVVMQKDAFGDGVDDRSLEDNIFRKRLRHMHRKLSTMCGRAIYEDARLAIYAPWGDPLPCADQPVERDTERRGCTEVSAMQLLERQDKDDLLTRLIPPAPSAGDDDSAEESPATLPLPAGSRRPFRDR